MTWDEPTPRQQHDLKDTQEAELTGCQPPLWLVGVMFIVLIASCFLSIELLGIVRGFMSPPSAPIPADARQLSHQSLGGRSSLAIYQIDTPPCEVINFYQQQGGTCVIHAGACGDDGRYTPPVYETDFFATCEKVTPFSIFGQRWQARLLPFYQNPSPPYTRFELQNDLLWGGFVPTPSINPP
jgi:hypothetical protein